MIQGCWHYIFLWKGLNFVSLRPCPAGFALKIPHFATKVTMTQPSSAAHSPIDVDSAKAAEFSLLTKRLQQGGIIAPNDIRIWCHLGLEQGHPALVQNVCQNLLAQDNVHVALRPYWLYFLGAALLHQLKVDEGVLVLRQGLEALCVAPRVYNRQIKSTKYEDPRIETLLWQALAQLAAGGVRAFAHAGTLLGLVREQRLLPFDKDLDLGLMVSELPLARSILLAHGWQPLRQIFPIDNMDSYHHPEVDVVIDLCGMEPEPGSEHLLGGFRINHGQPLGWQRFTRYPGPLKLELHDGPAGKIWQLGDPQRWLLAMYGESWRVPDPAFDTIIGAYNILGFSTLTQWYAFSKIINPWLEGHWEKAHHLTLLTLERHAPNDPLLLRVAKTLKDNLSSLKPGP
jgi:hypothetical protein